VKNERKHLYGHLSKLRNVKMENGERMVAAHEEDDPKLVLTSPYFYIITKLPFCHSELQKGNYGLKMLAQ